MSNILAPTDKRCVSHPSEILRSRIKELVQKKRINSRVCRRSLKIPCGLCIMFHKNHVSSGFESIGQLLKHINACHKTKDLDCDQNRIREEYIELLDGLAVIVDENPEHYAIYISIVTALLNFGGIYNDKFL